MTLNRLGILQSLFVSGLVVANIIAAKVVVVWHLVVPAAIIIYPLTFLLTDIIGELYGKEEATRTVWYGLLASVFAMVVIYVGMLLPVAVFMPEKQTAYETLLGPNRRIVLASLLAYLCSQKFDVWAFHYLRRLTKGRHKWLRNNLSTMTSQLVDTGIFIGFAFWGTVPHVGKMIVGQYVVKVLIALLETPVFYLCTLERNRDGSVGYAEKPAGRYRQA
jgi:queuosine precursor transporter